MDLPSTGDGANFMIYAGTCIIDILLTLNYL